MKSLSSPSIRSVCGLVLILMATTTIVVLAQFGGFDIGDAIKGADAAKKVAKGAAGISLKEELDVGGSLAMEIAFRKGGILKDPVLTKRVATIGKALTLYCTRPDLDFTFAILDNPEINAFSSPGGYVFVTKGLVDSCKSDHQLASVMAHEIAHVTRRHVLKLIAGKELTQGLLAGASMAGGGDFSGFDNLVGKIAESIMDNGMPKDDEYDADREGTLLAYDAGFPPRTLRDYLADLDKKNNEKAFPKYPKTRDRVERLDEEIDKMIK